MARRRMLLAASRTPAAADVNHRFNCQTARLRPALSRRARPARLVQTRVIAPCYVRPQGSPVVMRAWRLRHRAKSNVPCSPVGACGTTGRFTAPAAPAWFGCGQPACRFRDGTRAVAQPNAEDRWAEPGRGSRSSPAFRTRMDLSACCMSQGLSLAPTRPRSCELSPGHALGPSARCAGVCPVRLEDQKSSHVSEARHRCGHRIPLPRIEDDRDAPLTGAGCDRRYKSYREDQEQKANKRQLFFLKIRNSSRRFEAGVILLQQLADSAKAIGGCNR